MTVRRTQSDAVGTRACLSRFEIILLGGLALIGFLVVGGSTD
jgi:hypothetical protein